MSGDALVTLIGFSVPPCKVQPPLRPPGKGASAHPELNPWGRSLGSVFIVCSVSCPAHTNRAGTSDGRQTFHRRRTFRFLSTESDGEY